MSEENQLTNPEARILYVLVKHDGRSSFDHMMTESGMCFGMFWNYANQLLEKGYMEKGETFKDYIITPKGKRKIEEITGGVRPHKML
jgi:predicted transcriptional regulator